MNILAIGPNICLQEFYPDKKPLEAKAKKDYGKREKFDGFNHCSHIFFMNREQGIPSGQGP